MTRERDNESDGRALWRKARQAGYRPEAAARAPDEAEAANLLAAYLDGSLDAAARERVEAWLAADAAALDGLIAARAGLPAGLQGEAAAPAALIARAQGLVREAPARQGGGALGWLRDLLGPGQPVWQPVGLAAALLLACAAGFALGEVGYRDVIAETTVAQADNGFDLAPSGDDIF